MAEKLDINGKLAYNNGMLQSSIKTYRQRLKLTQKELALETGLSERTIRYFERGKALSGFYIQQLKGWLSEVKAKELAIRGVSPRGEGQ